MTPKFRSGDKRVFMTKRNQENEEREDKIGMNYQKGHKQKPIVATIN